MNSRGRSAQRPAGVGTASAPDRRRALSRRAVWTAIVIAVGTLGLADLPAISPAKPLAPATVTVVPGQAVAGSRLSLTGSEMPANRRGTVFLGSVPVAHVRVDAKGDWKAQVRVSAHIRAANSLRVVVGRQRIQVRFTVTTVSPSGSSHTSLAALSTGESVWVGPTRVRAGGRVIVRMAGFPRRAKVGLRLGRRRLTVARAGRDGSARVAVRIPARTRAGSYVMRIGAGDRGLRVALAVVIARSVTVKPAPAPKPAPVPKPPPVPAAPGLTAIPAQSVAQQAPIVPVTPAATGLVTGFSASGLPPGLVIDPRTGTISGVPTVTGTFAATVSVSGPGGGASTASRWTVGDPLVDAVGDMACAAADPNYNAGNGNPGIPAPFDDCLQRYVSNLVASPLPSALLDLGDNQYDSGALGDYQSVFGPTFGRANAVTYPVLGNAEYNDGSAPPSGFFSYFSLTGVFSRIQASGGNTADLTTNGYYSFNLGAWHIVALNSNCTGADRVSGGCAAGSPEESWLRQDLAANHQKCILAYWHHPRWNSGSAGNDPATAAFWTDLYSAHATLVVNGHGNHHYGRFRPQDPAGNPAVNGIREFIVSTGGQSHAVAPRTPGDLETSQVANYTTFGVLRLTLHPAGYDWRFAPAADGQPSTFSDSGSAPCS